MPLPTEKSKKRTNPLQCKYLWYGKPKIGKTTTASELAEVNDDGSRALFFPTEPGHNFVEIYKWQKTVKGKSVNPENWTDFVTCCGELATQEEAIYKMLVIDTVDILWKWCDEYICKMNDISHPSEMGFGKAYQAIAAEFSRVLNKLGNRGIGLIFISHRKEYEIKVGPRAETAYTHTLPAGATKFLDGFVDFIWFFSKDENEQRYIQTQWADNINAGSRGDKRKKPLPDRIEMEAKIIAEQVSKL